ncbi:PF20097 family protein [uncultured Clostridium sp.]|uniref:PF20097 family protein n=1 Tax=uncultured Clostridium sp. TaxID=59620 RepID=UPI0028E499E0|nr:PF20097 family protein [uncultured Clostridium sp.]
MKCPYCGEEMEQGVIQSPHEISWKNKKSYIGRAKFHEGSIILSKLYMLQGSAVIANCCRKCEKIIIDYKDGSCDMNQVK